VVKVTVSRSVGAIRVGSIPTSHTFFCLFYKQKIGLCLSYKQKNAKSSIRNNIIHSQYPNAYIQKVVFLTKQKTVKLEKKVDTA